MATKNKCDFNCLNCPFDDCIYDGTEISYEDLKRIRDEEKQRKIEDEIADPNTSAQRRYYLTHKDIYRKASRKYDKKHKAERQLYDFEHREESKERSRRNYKKNREMYLAYDRDRRRKEKEARENNPLR